MWARRVSYLPRDARVRCAIQLVVAYSFRISMQP